ncbi:hypothetical protein SD78_3885 [Bacillus badius]|nr:hypothetical protein SD78_3885 [Bacillus badius]
MNIKDSWEETKICKCINCGKEKHVKDALYCTRCGTKLIVH